MLLNASDLKTGSQSAPAGKKKRRASPEQIKASRNNSMKSTGPRDCSRTRLNAVKHALCCQLPVVMPGENAEEIQNKINRYIIEQGAETEAERDTVELAVMDLVRAKRAHTADTAAGTQVVHDVKREMEEQQGLRCAELVANLAASPAATIIRVQQFTQGIMWSVGQVEMLEQHLRDHPGCGFHPDQRVHAIHIFGHNPRDLFTDIIVADWNFLYVSALHGPGAISGEAAAELLATDRPEGMALDHFERRLGEAMRNLIDRREARARLQEHRARYKADLLKRREEVARREAIALALAVEAAMVSVNADSMKRLRYRRENERGYQAGMRLLHQMQVMRLKYGDRLGGTVDEEDPAPTASVSGPQPGVAAGDESPAQPGEQAVYRNEADATQVAGGPVGNDEPRTFSTVNLTIGRPDPATERTADEMTRAYRGRQDGSEVLKE